MVDESQVPIPEAEASSGQQEETHAETSIVTAIVPRSSNQNPFEKTIHGLATDNSKTLGGEVGAKMLAAMTSHMASENTEKKFEIQILQNEIKKQNNELLLLREKNAMLSERLKGVNAGNRIKSFSIFLGASLITFSVDYYSSGQLKIAGALAVAGLVSTILGWWLSPGGED